MKYARIIQRYKYDESCLGKNFGNIGDCFQNFAVENLYKEMGISDVLEINRDDIPYYKGEKAILPMQGWFGNVHNVFPANWSEDIHPVFVGFHLNRFNECRKKFIELKLYERMKNFEPVGCRDRNTRDFLRDLGVDAYFSACLSLTFPKREKAPENGKIFVVDLDTEAKLTLPDFIRENADYSITQNYYFKNYPITEAETKEFETEARKILNRYRDEAKLVVTSRIHVAMPCIAMGIPVIFIKKSIYDVRLDVLNGILPIYDLNSNIDWTPTVPDIENLKFLIKENAKNQIRKVAGLSYDNNYQDKIEQETRKLYTTIPDIKLKFLKRVENLINKDKRTVLWGASDILRNTLKTKTFSSKNILGVIDKNPAKKGELIGQYKIYAPEDLSKLNPDEIIITILNSTEERAKEIKEFLKENNCENTTVKTL